MSVHRPEESAHEFAQWWPLERMGLQGIKETRFCYRNQKLFGLGRSLFRRTLWVTSPTYKKIGLEFLYGCSILLFFLALHAHLAYLSS